MLDWKWTDYLRAGNVGASLIRGALQFTVSSSAGLFFISLTTLATSIAAILISLGIPHAEARKNLHNDGLKQGYSVGLAAALFGYNEYFVRSFVARSLSGGVMPNILRHVHPFAFNLGLAKGYVDGSRLTAKEKEDLLNILMKDLIDEAKARGTKLYMKGWSDRKWVLEYARLIITHHFK